MPHVPPDLAPTEPGGVTLRTLTLLRWVAIAGQSGAVLVATEGLDLAIPVGPVSAVIGLSVLVNLVAGLTAPRTRRLAQGEAAALFAFDIVQLGLLLALTGGLANPFAVLILAPVTIAATTLSGRHALGLGLLTVLVVSAIGLWNVPLRGPSGPLAPPVLLLWGFWLALAIGTGFLALYARRVMAERAAMAEALTATQMALARAQRLSDLDGVVAAAAHEMGTPLATIKLVTSEMLDELEQRPDLAHLAEDARLLREQADRCRDILRAMGRTAARDPYLDRAPLQAVVEEAAEPHLARGRTVDLRVPEGRQPAIPRRPEIVHGLRSLVQNAVDFSRERVEIRLDWSGGRVVVRIADDGPGFPPGLLDRIGDPLATRRAARERESRPGYEGMGLGLFIAKTLLERTGARITFANGARGGAVALVAWPLSALAAPDAPERDPAATAPDRPDPAAGGLTSS